MPSTPEDTERDYHEMMEREAEYEAERFDEWEREREIVSDIVMERRAQDAKWGQQNHGPDRWMNILMEEIGEISRARNDGDVENYRTEMVQSAAVLVAMIDAYDRGFNRPDGSI